MSSTRILFGFHAVTARLRTRPQSVHALYMTGARHDARARDVVTRAQSAGVAVHTVDEARLLQLTGHGRHQGIAALVDEALPYVTVDDVFATIDEPALFVVLDGVTDPHNLGACLRSADAFGAHALIAVTNLARTLRDLKACGVWIVGAEAGGESLFDADLTGSIAWVLGAEGAGLRRLTRESCDRIVGIPLQGTVESLNVSVATGICLYATRRARALASR
ncbi:MAG: 23S rRNA (guanosine(2251)-2'-O)-methyltransferase RlmB [Betaproteobacteria bacterium]|nr:MAG: 23S rRNA (guanosine(2251)-2'-O)-methyltransferase RlmB [Betaproteobacteria bacterium]